MTASAFSRSFWKGSLLFGCSSTGNCAAAAGALALAVVPAGEGVGCGSEEGGLGSWGQESDSPFTSSLAGVSWTLSSASRVSVGSGEGPRALAFELPGGVAGLVLRFLRGFLGCELLALLFSLSLLFLAALERLELLLSLLLLLLLDLLNFLGLLCEKDLDDRDLDTEYDLLWSDVGEIGRLT